jgi:hypothetical protein
MSGNREEGYRARAADNREYQVFFTQYSLPLVVSPSEIQYPTIYNQHENNVGINLLYQTQKTHDYMPGVSHRVPSQRRDSGKQ